MYEEPKKCTLFPFSDLFNYIFFDVFRKLSVHHQEDCTNSFTVFAEYTNKMQRFKSYLFL